MPVTAPPRKATSSAGPMPPRAASATRALARTETFMPMKPAAAEARPPMSEADGDLDVLEQDQGDEQDDADDADRRVLAAQVGRGALLDGRRRGRAWSRCRATAPAARGSSPRRRRRPRRRRPARRAPRGRSGSYPRKNPSGVRTKRKATARGPPPEAAQSNARPGAKSGRDLLPGHPEAAGALGRARAALLAAAAAARRGAAPAAWPPERWA